MKRLLVLIAGLLFAFTLTAQININYPFGNASSETVTVSNDTASFELIDLVNIVTLSNDTATHFYLSDLSTKAGALLYLNVTSDTTNFDVTLGSNFALDSMTVTSKETVTGLFLYDGTDFDMISQMDGYPDRLRSNTTTLSVAGPTDDVDIEGKSVLLVNTSSGDVTIGGFTGGALGQILYVLPSDATNNIILEDEEGGGNQDIHTATDNDKTITNSGGVTLVYNGSEWIDIDDD